MKTHPTLGISTFHSSLIVDVQVKRKQILLDVRYFCLFFFCSILASSGFHGPHTLLSKFTKGVRKSGYGMEVWWGWYFVCLRPRVGGFSASRALRTFFTSSSSVFVVCGLLSPSEWCVAPVRRTCGIYLIISISSIFLTISAVSLKNPLRRRWSSIIYDSFIPKLICGVWFCACCVYLVCCKIFYIYVERWSNEEFRWATDFVNLVFSCRM